jgi:CSLREA domain-containing protein
LVFAASAPAGTIAVTTNFDDTSAACSLREAVQTANDDADMGGCVDGGPAAPDTIMLSGGDHDLSLPGVEDANASGDLDVTEELTIQGAGAGVTAVDGNGSLTGDRVFDVFGSLLTLSGLTVHDGAGDGGGGIRATDSVTINNATVSGNTATGTSNGGGISAPTTIVANSIVSDNTSIGGSGGGAYAITDLTVADSEISTNRALGGNGGGVFGISVSVTDSTVVGNSASGGGGIRGNALNLVDSTVRRNEAIIAGGGVFTDTVGTKTISGTTIAANDADAAGGLFLGSTATPTSITNSTISGNEAATFGGGMASNGGTVSLRWEPSQHDLRRQQGPGQPGPRMQRDPAHLPGLQPDRFTRLPDDWRDNGQRRRCRSGPRLPRPERRRDADPRSACRQSGAERRLSGKRPGDAVHGHGPAGTAAWGRRRGLRHRRLRGPATAAVSARWWCGAAREEEVQEGEASGGGG